MESILTPTFKDFFNEPIVEPIELIKDVPSNVIIGYLSLINAQLFLGKKDISTQLQILENFTRRFPIEQKRDFLDKLMAFKIKTNATYPIIFNSWYVTEFIKYELLNYREFEFSDTTPTQEYNILKAYFIIAEKIEKKTG
jgi:hypothetical protein